MEKKLYRDEANKKIAGVCAGLAEYFDMDPTVVRLLFVVVLFLGGASVMAYVVLWIVLPRKNNYTFVDYNSPKVDYNVPPVSAATPTDPFTGLPYKRKSNAGLIVGVVLIFLGGIFLLDQLNLIPDWDYGSLWPLIIVAVGVTLIVSGKQKKPWEHHDWNQTLPNNEAPKTDNSINDNPTPTV